MIPTIQMINRMAETAMQSAMMYSTINNKVQTKIMEMCKDSPWYLKNH